MAFLGVHLFHRPDGTITTTVFRKPVHTNQYLNLELHHPLSHKSAVVCTLKYRALTHTSSKDTLISELSIVFFANGYPRQMIDCYMRPCPSGREPFRYMYVSSAFIPYICEISEEIRRVLQSCYVRVTRRPCTTLKKILLNLKDKIPAIKRPCVVYRVTCSDCHASYIGETGRLLKKRVQEHRKAIQKANFDASVLSEHA